MAGNSSSAFLHYFHQCSDATFGFIIAIVFNVAKFSLHLPPSLLVLYLGLQRWRRPRLSTTTTHADIFTYQVAALELIYALGAIFYLCGEFTGLSNALVFGYYLCSIVMPGQIFFHVLTCVERYLATVHPVIYLGLRQSRGVRIRNISISCAWLLCFGWMGVTALYIPKIAYVPTFCLFILSLVVVSFCSLSVLCVLSRPGPRETGRDRVQVDQSKHRAFNTLLAIMGVLWLCFLGYLVCLAVDISHLLSYNESCMVLISGNMVTLPSNLVLPLLFLHRAGKLACCQRRNK